MRSILFCLLGVLFVLGCKKDSGSSPSGVGKHTCAGSLDAEYKFRTYKKGILQSEYIGVISDKTESVMQVSVIDPSYSGPLKLEVNCSAGTFVEFGKSAPVGKIYGDDSLILEDGDYKWVYISRK